MSTCSQECCTSIIGLFQQGNTRCAAIAVAVLAFLLGVVVMCAVCKMFCRKSGKSPCGCKKAAPAKNPCGGEKKAERPFEKRKPHPAPADGSVELYVGNLSYETTEEQLRKEFEAFGKVNGVRLVTNRYNGKSKGYGFVQMPDRAEAEKAAAAMNDRELQGRKIKCNEAKNLI